MSEDRTELGFQDRRQHRKLLRFDPTISSGMIMQLVTLLILFGSAWATYSSDRATTNLRLDRLEKQAESEKGEAREAIQDLRSQMQRVAETVSSVDRNLAVLQAGLGNDKRKP